ncbi:MAG: hypothetical protein LQ351_001346 [Letrouitia transgressa]|nr:MAG: hypothetical protein LQ351_001346 [Letrouitia transgressa]
MSPIPPPPAADIVQDADDEAMLSAMGFSSFVSGPNPSSASQPHAHATKKRKTGNPDTTTGAGSAGRGGKNPPVQLHGKERSAPVEKEDEEGVEGNGRTDAERQSATGIEKGGKGEGEGGGFEGYTWSQWKRGVRVENGDVAFYDESFVEDPWEGLRDRGGE